MKMISELFLVLTLSIIGIYIAQDTTQHKHICTTSKHLPQFIENHTFKENFPQTNKQTNSKEYMFFWGKWQMDIQL